MKETEERLNKLSTALEHAPTSIIITDSKGNIEYVNQKYTEVTGYTIDEAVGNIPNMLKPGSQSREKYQDLWETILNGSEWTGEIKNLKKNGERYREQVSISSLKDNSGTITNFIYIKNEIKDELPQSEKNYRLLFDSISYAQAVLNFDNVIMQCNKSLLIMNNLDSKDNIIGKRIHDLILKSDHSKLDHSLELSIKGPGLEFVECRLIDKNGENPLAELSIIILRDDNGAPSGRVVVLRDISANKEKDDALHESEIRNLAILEAIPDIMFRINRKGEYLDESLIKKVYKIFPEDIIRESIPYINNAFNTGQIQIFEYPLILENEDEIYYEARFIVSDSDEVLVILRNITERVLTRKELVIAKEAAESANRAKSRFLANMSHEIRTPLHSILGFIELLYRTETNKQQIEYLDIVSSSSKNLLGIINDVIDFSKIESEKLEIDNVLFDPLTEFESTINLFNVKSNEKNILLNSFIDPRLPGQVSGDPLRIKQVLSNLLSNAIKFTPNSGDIRISIELAGISKDKIFITFSVTDTGIGIPEYKQKVIFDAFNQSDTTITRRFGGSGLGLSICRDLVHLMGGELELESEKGLGSTFQFTLPMERVNKDDSKTIPELDPNMQVGITVPWKKSISDIVITRYLIAFGCTTLWISLPQESEKMNYIDILIHIDTINRREILNELFDENRPCPILVIAHETSRPDLEQYQDSIDQLLYYPLFPLTLYKAVNTAIARWKGIPDELDKSQTRDEQMYNARILVAEDNLISQKLMKHIFVDFEIQVDIAGNGLTAFEMYCINKYDLVFMDINMPVAGGIEATEMILEYESKHNLPHTPIVALTAKAMKNDRENILQNGMDDYLAKPFEMTDLRRILHKYLAHTISESKQEELQGDDNVEEYITNPDDLYSLTESMGLTPEILKSLIIEFVEISQEYLKELDDALDSEDPGHLTDAAHKLRGVSANLRLKTIMDFSKTLEEDSGALSQKYKRELVVKIKENIDLIKEKFAGSK